MLRRLLVYGLISVGVGLASGVFRSINAEQVITPAPTVRAVEISQPREILIPKIEVRAEIIPVGQDEEGRMASPETEEVVGWYDRGPKPGEKGNSVMAGHFDGVAGRGVFYNLTDLERGDAVVVRYGDGIERTFTVLGKEKYEDEDFPVEGVFGDANGAFLNLVTCGGVWDEVRREYSDRVVVFTQSSEKLLL